MWVNFKCAACSVEWADADIEPEDVMNVEGIDVTKDETIDSICEDCRVTEEAAG